MTPPPHILRALENVARTLDRAFLGKSELIRLLLVSVAAGEHVLIVGPPGTAKSALVRHFAELVRARYFEYLLTRFTEPNELFGPIDIQAFREGDYRRRTEGMLPEAELVFLDEIFKANSAILNSLLGILNERTYVAGSRTMRVPLLSALAASNEVPNDQDLAAVFDRFLLRVRSDNLDAYRFHDLLVRGLGLEAARAAEARDPIVPLLTSADLRSVQQAVALRLELPEDLLTLYKTLLLQIRAEGVSVSDRRAVKLLKVVAASALLDGRSAPDTSDLFVLKHIWNSVDQCEVLDAVVDPVLEAWAREHPEARRLGPVDVGVDALMAEVLRIREVLLAGRSLSDTQLFSQLKALNEIRTALLAMGTAPAGEAAARVDELLGHVFQSGRFAP